MRVLLRFLGRDRAGQANPLAGAGGINESAAARTCALSASLLVREPDDDGPRVFCMSRALGGTFRFCRGEVEARLRRAFPSLRHSELRAAAGILEARVREAMAPLRQVQKRSWVHGWRE
jgi:hypothetical protein